MKFEGIALILLIEILSTWLWSGGPSWIDGGLDCFCREVAPHVAKTFLSPWFYSKCDWSLTTTTKEYCFLLQGQSLTQISWRKTQDNCNGNNILFNRAFYDIYLAAVLWELFHRLQQMEKRELEPHQPHKTAVERPKAAGKKNMIIIVNVIL